MATSRGFTALNARALDKSLTTAALDYLRTAYSHAYGGFGTAPKFPSPANLEFLLSEYERNSGLQTPPTGARLQTPPTGARLQTPPTGNESLLQMVTRTLDMMAYGGMYDQIGGGFHRYSVDAKWLIPHFEKMLYDNAQLAKVYLQAYQLTQEPRYRRIAEEIFSYIFREMTAPEGGFYSALDAETDTEEGNITSGLPMKSGRSSETKKTRYALTKFMAWIRGATLKVTVFSMSLKDQKQRIL